MDRATKGIAFILILISTICSAQTYFPKGIIIGNTENAAVTDSITLDEAGRARLWFHPQSSTDEVVLLETEKPKTFLEDIPPALGIVIVLILFGLIFALVVFIRDHIRKQ